MMPSTVKAGSLWKCKVTSNIVTVVGVYREGHQYDRHYSVEALEDGKIIKLEEYKFLGTYEKEKNID